MLLNMLMAYKIVKRHLRACTHAIAINNNNNNKNIFY